MNISPGGKKQFLDNGRDEDNHNGGDSPIDNWREELGFEVGPNLVSGNENRDNGNLKYRNWEETARMEVIEDGKPPMNIWNELTEEVMKKDSSFIGWRGTS